MVSKKDEGLPSGERAAANDAPPAYNHDEDQSNAGPSTAVPGSSSPLPLGPTADSPFDFPSQSLPPYSASVSASASGPSSSSQLPIAIPQATPKPDSIFLPAYAPALLAHGITVRSWTSFLDTVSAFLAAKVSDRAISHAADVGRSIGDAPKSYFKGVASHAKEVGKRIGKNAKSGNVVGAAFGVIGGSISIPLSAALGAVRTTAMLPGSTVMAVAKKPQTPRERATAYVAVANKDWFHGRGLNAILLDTLELSQLLGASVIALAEAGDGKNTSVDQLGSLQGHIAKLDVLDESATLELGNTTLWLVLTQVDHGTS